MFEKLDDRHDEIVYYISHHELRIARDNFQVIRELLMFILVGYLVLLSGLFIFSATFVFRPVYLLPPVILALLYKLHQFLEKRMPLTFRRVRVFALIFYALMTMPLTYLDILGSPLQRGVVFPIALMVISAFYTDYFFVMLGYKAALFALYLVFLFLGKDRSQIGFDVLIALVVLAVGMFSYGVSLGSQTDRGQESDELAAKSQTDLLTQLYNKISFEEKSREFLSRRLPGHSCSLFILDFDNFKHVNDNYGHQVGDQVLQTFGQILKKSFRAADIIGRVGGDEFMVLVTGPMPEGYIAKRCKEILNALYTTHIGEAWGFSCSIGVAEDKSGKGFDELYVLADEALYEAKERGKATFVEWTAELRRKKEE